VEALSHADPDGHAPPLGATETAPFAPETPATEVVSQEIVHLVTLVDTRSGVALTARWRTIARFGGSLDRKSDPPPGWQTFWQGWGDIQTI
jgi:hypothetical protein